MPRKSRASRAEASRPDPPSTTARRALVALTLAAFACAATLHLAVWRQHGSDPFSETPISDALAYDRWARRIAAEGLAAEPVFHQPPLYPLALSATYAMLDGSPRAATLLQALLGAAAIALLVPLGATFFRSTAAGVVAAALAGLHGPFPFHAVKLLPVTLAVLTQGAALLALGAARARGSPRLSAVAGALLALAVLARAEMLLFVPFALAAVAWPIAESRGRRPAAALTLALGFSLLIAPATLHNLRRGDTVLVASAGGENLFIGNQRGASGGHQALHPRAGDIFSQRELAREVAEREQGRPLRPSEVSAYWRSRAWKEMLADPGGWLVLEFKKLGRIVDLGDPSDMYSLALERARYLPVLHLAFVPVGLLLGAGAIGLVRSLLRDRRRVWPLAALVAVQLVALLVFFVSTRLRLPLVFALTPFAGFAIVDGLGAWRAGRRRPVAVAAVALLALSVLSVLVTSRVPPREIVRLASVLSQQGRLDEALDVLRPATEGRTPYAVALDQQGWILHKRGDLAAAAASYRRALAAGMPEGRRAQTHTRLAMVLERTGDLDEAAEQHDLAVLSPGADAGTYYERGVFRLRRGDTDGARADLELALRADPSWPAPREALARLPR